jgi:hypothetical protein
LRPSSNLADVLNEYLKDEKSNESQFTELPFFYYEIAQLLFRV